MVSFNILSCDDVRNTINKSILLLERVGVKFYHSEALKILDSYGVTVDFKSRLAKIPESLTREALRKIPRSFTMYTLNGKPWLNLSEGNVYFAPGATAIKVIDLETDSVRTPTLIDEVNFVKLTDSLQNIHINAAPFSVFTDAPKILAERYRIAIAFKYSSKPFFGASFSLGGIQDMYRIATTIIEPEDLQRKPRWAAHCCPSPPFKWSDIVTEINIECAKHSVPIIYLAMPIAGLTAPATIIGAVTQCIAEDLAGLVLAQIINPGNPCILGGSPITFDVKAAASSLGAIETVMMNSCIAQIGKYLNLPTVGFIGISDSKTVDIQSAIEGAIGFTIGSLAGLNVIQGPGMLESESCQSYVKLVIDNEICGLALRAIKGVNTVEESFCIDVIENVGAGGDYSKNIYALKSIIDWARKEFYFPSQLIDRESRESWERKGRKDMLIKAKEAAKKLINTSKAPLIDKETEEKIHSIIKEAAKKHNIIETIPKIP
ncbi:MAG: trimethylamine methyltransferase family protein [Ignisphaera sp.]